MAEDTSSKVNANPNFEITRRCIVEYSAHISVRWLSGWPRHMARFKRRQAPRAAGSRSGSFYQRGSTRSGVIAARHAMKSDFPLLRFRNPVWGGGVLTGSYRKYNSPLPVSQAMRGAALGNLPLAVTRSKASAEPEPSQLARSPRPRRHPRVVAAPRSAKACASNWAATRHGHAGHGGLWRGCARRHGHEAIRKVS